ncbi:MAG TPA: glycosyltransferase family 2 protein [Candidatus Brocadiia bacterium]|nr:glycosyltransferase family 2 protein [Candidatus Brocadiales bacterium]
MIYILLPTYNEEQSVEPLLLRIKKGMSKRNYQYFVVVYNDGSTDNTSEILKRNVHDIPLVVIGEMGNKGLGYAMKSLVNKVLELSTDDDDITIVLDADNTHNPEHIFRMVDDISDGFDIVIASRFLRDSRTLGVPKYRNLLSIIASYLMKILFPIKGVRDYTCGYRAYRVGLLRNAKNIYGDALITERGFACMAELLIKLRRLGILAVEIPLVLKYNLKGGKSKMDVPVTILKTLRLIWRSLFRRSTVQ